MRGCGCWCESAKLEPVRPNGCERAASNFDSVQCALPSTSMNKFVNPEKAHTQSLKLFSREKFGQLDKQVLINRFMQQNVSSLFSNITDKTTGHWRRINVAKYSIERETATKKTNDFRAQNLTNYWIPEQNDASANSIDSSGAAISCWAMRMQRKNKWPKLSFHTFYTYSIPPPSLFSPLSSSLPLFPPLNVDECCGAEENRWRNNFALQYDSNCINSQWPIPCRLVHTSMATTVTAAAVATERPREQWTK